MKRRIALIAAAVIASTSCTALEPNSAQDAATAHVADECQVAECDWNARLASVSSYLASRPGNVGFVLRDRRTGFIHGNEFAGVPVGTASTIKLAMATDLLLRARRGAIELSPDDWVLMDSMLYSSDDVAADELWWRYSGDDGLEFNRNFWQFGMTNLAPQPGTEEWPYWGTHTCTPSDLDRLMQFVLTSLDGRDRDYLVSRMQSVAENQQWGVWAAGTDQMPGTKAGWSEEQAGWAINSVGFSGIGQRFTLAIMNSLEGEGGFDEGVETISTVSRMLLSGLSDSA